jgi:hypothetical protein
LTVDRSDRTYIHQPGKGFAFHTTEFVNGYLHGFCLANHGGGIEVRVIEIHKYSPNSDLTS